MHNVGLKYLFFPSFFPFFLFSFSFCPRVRRYIRTILKYVVDWECFFVFFFGGGGISSVVGTSGTDGWQWDPDEWADAQSSIGTSVLITGGVARYEVHVEIEEEHVDVCIEYTAG